FANMEKWSQAVQSYRIALQIDPNHDSVHIRLATALQRAGRQDEAIQEYQEALRLNPNDLVAAQQLLKLK
ncbi:MAG TPA: tetratricopeptide repeat protein, partial [Candidatus Baltobacteraceae bacterium]|nr:tetratricopeptide repeat protein [Candidatus Baltobacteraceae bacterium]